MQAVIIQQDGISGLTRVIAGNKIDLQNLPAWSRVLALRNMCAGHPARRDLPRTTPLTRSFMGRMFGGYDSFEYEQWEQGTGTTYPQGKLGALLDEYAVEAEVKLADVLSAMRTRWPQ